MMFPYNSYKYIAILAAALGLFAGGYWAGRGQKVTEIHEIEKKGETITKIVDRIVTVTRIVHPDGTTEETTTTENKDENIKEKEKSTTSDTSIHPIASNYSLGIYAWAPLTPSKWIEQKTYSLESIQVSVGRRLIGDLWVDAGIRMNKELSLGIRLQF